MSSPVCSMKDASDVDPPCVGMQRFSALSLKAVVVVSFTSDVAENFTYVSLKRHVEFGMLGERARLSF